MRKKLCLVCKKKTDQEYLENNGKELIYKCTKCGNYSAEAYK